MQFAPTQGRELKYMWTGFINCSKQFAPTGGVS